jgi:hypothetical protein
VGGKKAAMPRENVVALELEKLRERWKEGAGEKVVTGES